jgi:hypothetical protein
MFLRKNGHPRWRQAERLDLGTTSSPYIVEGVSIIRSKLRYYKCENRGDLLV